MVTPPPPPSLTLFWVQKKNRTCGGRGPWGVVLAVAEQLLLPAARLPSRDRAGAEIKNVQYYFVNSQTKNRPGTYTYAVKKTNLNLPVLRIPIRDPVPF